MRESVAIRHPGILLRVILGGSLILCAVLCVGLVRRYDLYNREPWFMVVLAVALGAIVMAPMGAIEMLSFEALGLQDRPVVGLALIAATHEELARVVVVALIAVFVPRHFDDPMDGLIYGSMVALGMALEESRSFLRAEQASGMLPGTEYVRLTGHLVMGGIGCMGVGMARMRLPGWPLWLLVALAGSMLLHFAWDCIALDAMRRGFMPPASKIGAVVIMIGGMFVYGILVVLTSDWSRRVFAPHDPKRLWGWPIRIWIR